MKALSELEWASGEVYCEMPTPDEIIESGTKVFIQGFKIMTKTTWTCPFLFTIMCIGGSHKGSKIGGAAKTPKDIVFDESSVS